MKLWKQLVVLSLLLVVTDGALRKWVLEGQALWAFVLKDVVLWGGYLLYAWERDPFALPRPLRSTWISVLLGGYVFLVLAQAFNPRQPALIVAALGLKYHLAFVPLAVLVPALIADTTERTFTRVLWAYSILVYLPIVALGIYQFFQPPTAWINRFVTDTDFIPSVGQYPRITGTFSYIGSFAPFLFFNAFLGASVLLAGGRWQDKSLKLLGAVLCAATVVVLPMTGSRSAVVIPGVALAGLFLVMRMNGKWRRLLWVTAIGVLVIGGFGAEGVLQGWSTLGERFEETGSEEAERRVTNVFASPFDGIEQGGLFGYGVGTNAKPAARFVSVSDWEGRYSGDRADLRLIMELGTLGWLFLVTLKLGLLYTSVQTCRRSRSKMEFIVGATAFCVVLSNLPLPVVFNVVDSVIHWGSVGAMLGARSLQKVRRRIPVAQ
jgi:hypothetical protein